MAWHILVPLIWLAGSLGFALGWALRALLERRMSQESGPALDPSARTLPFTAGASAHRTSRRREDAPRLRALALGTLGAALVAFTAGFGFAYAGVDLPGTLAERTFRTVFRVELPNQKPRDDKPPPDPRRRPLAPTHAAPVRPAPGSGCETYESVGAGAPLPSSGVRHEGSRCLEVEGRGASEARGGAPAGGSRSGSYGTERPAASERATEGEPTEGVAQGSIPREGERASQGGAETPPEGQSRPGGQEQKPASEGDTKGGESPAREGSQGQKPSPDKGAKRGERPSKEDSGGNASSVDQGDKSSIDEERAKSEEGRRGDKPVDRGAGAPAERGGKGAPPQAH